MKFFCLLITLLLSFQVRAQQQNQYLLKEYFIKMHQSAVSVCKGNIDEAKSLYFTGITSLPNPYLIDLNNAIYAEVNSKMPNTDRVISYLSQIQSKGICVHQKYENRALILPFTELVDEASCKKVKNERDRDLIVKAIMDDQSIRETLIKSRSEGSSDLPKVVRKLYVVDSINYQIVYGIMNRALEQKIPLQDYVGMKGYYDALTIILHYSEQKYDAVNMFKMVREGVLDPRDVFVDFDECVSRGYIHTQAIGNECSDFQPFGTTTIIQTFPTIIIKIPSESCLSKINEFRRKHYLQDLIEECKIKAYAQYNYKNGFSYPMTNLAVESNELNEMEKKITLKYKIIKYKDAADFDFNRGY